MPSEETLAQCREMGKALREEIADAREDIDRLARSLKAAFEEAASKEDVARLEKAIAAIERLISENA
jgi:hypothetical protein